MNARNIRAITDRICRRGTLIVSFIYDNIPRNVLLGAKVADDYPAWGEHLNYILTKHNGKFYIAGIDQNRGDEVKIFDVAKIQNPSF